MLIKLTPGAGRKFGQVGKELDSQLKGYWFESHLILYGNCVKATLELISVPSTLINTKEISYRHLDGVPHT